MKNRSTRSLGPYVFEDIADGVLLLSCDGTIAYMNKSSQAMLNIADNQLGCSLPGTWLRQTDSRNDDLCQSILDALYDKQTKIAKTVPPSGGARQQQQGDIRLSHCRRARTATLPTSKETSSEKKTKRTWPRPQACGSRQGEPHSPAPPHLSVHSLPSGSSCF